MSDFFMDFNSYQEKALKTADYTDDYHQMQSALEGLAGEVGELIEKKKKLTQVKGIIKSLETMMNDDEIRKEILHECGDILWYLTALLDSMGYTINLCAETNIEKLTSRKKRNKIHGTGDFR